MNIFIICPVRNCTEEWKDGLSKYVTMLENQGHKVHYPPRDTNQNDNIGYNICIQNKKAIEEADEIHIAWDGKSEGCLFDIGIAFALNKRVQVITGYFPELPKIKQKSFVTMIWNWEGKSNNY